MLKQIIKRKLNNIKNKNTNKTDDNSIHSKSSSNDEIYIYNGSNNFLIRNKYIKKELNDIDNNDNNNNYNYKSNILQNLKSNTISDKNITIKSLKYYNNNSTIYKKKITNNSLSVSKKIKKEDI